MLNLKNKNALLGFILFGFLVINPCLVQASSNPYYIGPSGNLEGTVTDSTGNPIANAYVYYTAGEDYYGYGFYYANTDEEGKFSFANVIPGSGVVSVSASRWYKEAKIDGIEVTENNTTTQTVTLKPAETGSINGRVTNSETGDPISGVTIRAIPDYYYPMMLKGMENDMGMGSGMMMSGEKNNMSLGMGNMTIVKGEEGIIAQKFNPSKIKAQKAKSDMKHKGKKHKGKKKKGTKKGENLTRSFAKIFYPNYYIEDSASQAVTDSNGNYSFDKLPVGSYSVYVDLGAKSGFDRTEEQYVEIEAGDSQEVSFKLIPLKTGSISGKVLNPEGDPVYGAIVDIYGNDVYYSYYGYTVSDKEGNFSMLAVPAGEYQVTAIGQDFWLSSKFYDVSVKEGETSSVDIKFEETSAIPEEGEKGEDSEFVDMAD